MEKMNYEPVGQASRRVHVVAGHTRASAARGSALRRPATRGAHTFSENGRYCSFDSVKMISLTAKIDSVGSLKP